MIKAFHLILPYSPLYLRWNHDLFSMNLRPELLISMRKMVKKSETMSVLAGSYGKEEMGNDENVYY
ncbi:hypothetical protein M8C21_008653 [Ambrosia artemisiifolia]|uniref:Uncharacterized protein n=1 Tax=Ambrosia artemisiifolia TaxID=4212 RepID=A0AAD5GIF9_AMBAR|nr:hypothetical protein M8C21_008653 [Ambrosia artemisiifolia]